MHMPDGGYRPAYNGQFASDPRTQVIVAVGLDTTGSDGGLMAPLLYQIVAYLFADTTHNSSGGGWGGGLTGWSTRLGLTGPHRSRYVL